MIEIGHNFTACNCIWHVIVSNGRSYLYCIEILWRSEMTFDEALEHFRNNTDISGTAVFLDDIEDTLKELRDEYAPTVEMKPYQFEVFKKYRYGISKGDIDFGGIWSDKPYRMMQYFKEESYTGTTIWDDNFAKAWLHPETIKIVDE